jgi:hypothetical protein
METLSLDINSPTIESKVDEKDPHDAPTQLSLPASPLPALPEELLGLKLANTKQKDDCLYLYSQEQHSDCATKILEAIAPSTQDLQSSVLYAEGIRRLKLHGHFWALGVDLPIAESASIAAALIASLRGKLPQVKLKLLLQNHCLNLLCETRAAKLQAEMALPILDALRNLKAAEYFQSVTVSNRTIGQKKPNWSFEIDLLAIGSPVSEAENNSIFDDLSLQIDEIIEESPDLDLATQEHWWTNYQKLAHDLSDRLMVILQPVIQLEWLGKKNTHATGEPISLPIGLISLAIGLGTTFTIDRLLSYQTQANLAPAPTTTITNSEPNYLASGLASGKSAKDIAKIEDKPSPNFNIAALNEKLVLIDWHITQKQRSPDVMIVGSSRALRGIEPSALEQALAKKGYKNISAFNFGIDGATAQVVNIQITQILERPQLPKMIIWADGLRAFNSKRSDITYDEITASVGYKQIQEKLKNQGNAPIAQNFTTPLADSSSNPITQAIAQVFSTSNQRQEVRNSVIKNFDRNTQALSNSESLIAANAPKTANILDPKGFVSFDVTFDPNTYFQKYPQVPGDYDLDYRNFETNGSQFDAFNNVVEFCQRNNIQLVVLNMPLHETYLDAIRQTYEATFNTRMEELAKREGFVYLNLASSLATQSALFSDPSHLNKQGAIAIAQAIAQNPKIPWQFLK